MAEHRDIDERDIDRLLAALTDNQIAALFGMTEVEVYQLRQSRQPKPPRSPNDRPRPDQNPDQDQDQAQSNHTQGRTRKP